MTQSEYITYKEQAFDAFIKTVIRNESASLFRSLARKNRRELNFSSLTEETLLSFQSLDSYQPEVSMFQVRGYRILVADPTLAQALQFLHPHKREVILLSYFLNQSDLQIGKLLNVSPTTIHYRRKTGLETLKKHMEALDLEKQGSHPF